MLHVNVIIAMLTFCITRSFVYLLDERYFSFTGIGESRGHVAMLPKRSESMFWPSKND